MNNIINELLNEQRNKEINKWVKKKSNKIITKTMINWKTSPCYFFILFVVLHNAVLLHSKGWVQCHTISYRDSFSRSCNDVNGVVVSFGLHAAAVVVVADTLCAAAAVHVTVLSGWERPWPRALSKIILRPGVISWWFSNLFIISSME